MTEAEKKETHHLTRRLLIYRVITLTTRNEELVAELGNLRAELVNKIVRFRELTWRRVSEKGKVA